MKLAWLQEMASEQLKAVIQEHPEIDLLSLAKVEIDMQLLAKFNNNSRPQVDNLYQFNRKDLPP